MNRNLWRLLIALVISTSCFVGTKMWYQSTRAKADGAQLAKIAVLTDARNEVQRKSQSAFIWEGLNGNDDLYTGEQIRTLANSEAEIFLESSKATIRLEPNSLVVLEENEDGLSLDFLEGNLFVQGGEGGDKAIKVKSCGEGKTDCSEINLKSADMSLSRKGDDVSLEVFKGQAELQSGGKTVALDKDKSALLSKSGVNVSEGKVQLLSPLAGETVLLNFSKGEQVDVTWPPLPPGYRVSLEMGNSRGSLSKLADVETNGETGKLSVKQKPGKWFVRLVAKPQTQGLPELNSMVTPYIVQPKAAPSLTEPAIDAQVLLEDTNQEISFRWLSRIAYEKQTLEVSKDAKFQSMVINTEVPGSSTTYKGALKDGTYFWRVTGFIKIKGKTESIQSSVSKFSVVSEWDLRPANLIAPQKEQRIALFDVEKSGVTFKWQPSPGTERFKVTISKKTEAGTKAVLERETQTPVMKISELNPGSYVWNVTSFDSRGGKTKNSETWDFSIDKLPRLEWADAGSVYEYPTSTPTLSTRWKPMANGEASKYRFRVVEDGLSIEEASWQVAKDERFEALLPGGGKYLAVVEALNTQGQTIAATDPKLFTVKRMPLLPGPRWQAGTPQELKTDNKGNISFAWEPVEGAKNYLMILETLEGKVVEEQEIDRNTASLNRMKPGQYQVRIKTVDDLKRPGPNGEPKKITVPNTSDIKAPKIKMMKVK